jgi:hypothetical protein
MCYNCGEQGHYANRCPNPHTHVNQPAIATAAPTHGDNSVPIAAKQNYARGRVNHVAVEEGQEAPNVVIGMFLVNDTSTVLLFDSGAPKFSWISWILLKVYRRIFKDKQAHDRVAREG